MCVCTCAHACTHTLWLFRISGLWNTIKWTDKVLTGSWYSLIHLHQPSVPCFNSITTIYLSATWKQLQSCFMMHHIHSIRFVALFLFHKQSNLDCIFWFVWTILYTNLPNIFYIYLAHRSCSHPVLNCSWAATTYTYLQCIVLWDYFLPF